ncbi:MAG: hypothetical protein AAB409_08880, partial [Gemmatimonadota bacterium]
MRYRSLGLTGPTAFAGVLVALVAGLGAATAARAQALAPAERRIAAWVDAHTEEAIGFLERSVNINSGSLNLAGVRAVADLYAPELTALGF